MNLFLASASPRRRELMTQIGVGFTVVASSYHESAAENGRNVPMLAEENAVGKARGAVWPAPGICIGADTLVTLDGIIMGKPRNDDDARDMLLALSGRTHEVVTGLAVMDHSGRQAVGHEITRVTFRRLSVREVDAYIASGEPADKAGAYAIQGKGALFVPAIAGCYSNVVGLPLSLLGKLVHQLSGETLTELWG